METDPLTTMGAVGIAVLLAQMLGRLANGLLDKVGKSGNGNGFEGRMMKMASRFDAFSGRMSSLHEGPGAIDPKSGTPRMWNAEVIAVLEDIRRSIQDRDKGEEKLRVEILRYLKEQDAVAEKNDAHYMALMETQNRVLSRLVETVDGCDFCRESRSEMKAGG